jgi:hypothetical protein
MGAAAAVCAHLQRTVNADERLTCRPMGPPALPHWPGPDCSCHGHEQAVQPLPRHLHNHA